MVCRPSLPTRDPAMTEKPPNDLQIARSTTLRPLEQVARLMDLGADDLEMYGRTKAKVSLDVLSRPERRP